jgi:hypothetical protein
MKSIFLSLVFSFCFVLCHSQKPFYYKEVIEVDTTTTKEELFERARLWFNDNFTSSNEVIQVADRNYGELVCRGIIPYNTTINELRSAIVGEIRFDVKIYFKKGRYKYEFTNFRHEGTGGYGWTTGNLNTQYPPISFGLLTVDTLMPKDRLSKTIDYRWQNIVWRDLKLFAGGRSFELVELLKKYMATPAPARKENW